MNWLLFTVLAISIIGIIWYWRASLHRIMEQYMAWARGHGERTLIIALLGLYIIPVIPQNIITVWCSTLRLRWGIPLSLTGVLLRVWVCCTVAHSLVNPVSISVIKHWWEAYLVLQLSPHTGAGAAGLQIIGHPISTILLLTVPVAIVNTTLLVLFPNGIWQAIKRNKQTQASPTD